VSNDPNYETKKNRGIGVGFSLVVLLVPPIAHELGQASPPLIGWLMAVAAAGVLLAADAIDKWSSACASAVLSAHDGRLVSARHAMTSMPQAMPTCPR
jgi:hypothetical protein